MRREREKVRAIDVGDRTLPADHAGERELVATAFHDAKNRPELLAAIPSADFDQPALQTIWGAIDRLESAGKPVDVVTLVAELRDVMHELGDNTAKGFPFLNGIISRNAAAPRHALEWARQLREVAHRRRIITQAQLVIGEAFTLAPDRVDGFAARALDQMAEACMDKTATGGPATLGAITEARLVELRDQWAGKRDPWGMRLPYPMLHKMTHGLRPGQVVFVGGDTGSGKTIVGLEVALDLAGRVYHGEKIAVGYLSLEMPRADIWNRAVCAMTLDPYTKRRGVITASELQSGPKTQHDELDLTRCGWIEQASRELEEVPLFIDDCGHDMCRVRATVRRMQGLARQRGARLRLVVVDHFHLLKFDGKAERRDIAIADACEQMKRLAVDDELVMLPLAQFNREASKRAPDQLPTVTDVKDGSAIEQIADTMILMHRPWLLHRNKTSAEAKDVKHTVLAVLAKSRETGWLGHVSMRFGGTNRFEERDSAD
jgi:replicative DNA helicase